MNRGVLAMSSMEVERLRLIDRVLSGGLSQKKAAAMARVLRQLGIKLILAKAPQAKGRIERLFRTLQNRLVK